MEKENFETLIELFKPTMFNSIEELDAKINELEIDLHGREDAVGKLRTLAGFMYRKHKVKSALYYLKIKPLSQKELELFLYVDEFEPVKDNYYTWMNGNISALFVVEIQNN